jgi:hypothetical protein
LFVIGVLMILFFAGSGLASAACGSNCPDDGRGGYWVFKNDRGQIYKDVARRQCVFTIPIE